MPTNKALGIDGLTVEFYCIFWDILNPDLTRVWVIWRGWGTTHIEQEGHANPFSQEVVFEKLVTSLPAVHGLQGHGKSYLMCLKSVLVDMIHSNETCMVLGHTIFNNLYLVWDHPKLTFWMFCHSPSCLLIRLWSCFLWFLLGLYASAQCLVKLNWKLKEPILFSRVCVNFARCWANSTPLPSCPSFASCSKV